MQLFTLVHLWSQCNGLYDKTLKGKYQHTSNERIWRSLVQLHWKMHITTKQTFPGRKIKRSCFWKKTSTRNLLDSKYMRLMATRFKSKHWVVDTWKHSHGTWTIYRHKSLQKKNENHYLHVVRVWCSGPSSTIKRSLTNDLYNTLVSCFQFAFPPPWQGFLGFPEHTRDLWEPLFSMATLSQVWLLCSFAVKLPYLIALILTKTYGYLKCHGYFQNWVSWTEFENSSGTFWGLYTFSPK